MTTARGKKSLNDSGFLVRHHESQKEVAYFSGVIKNVLEIDVRPPHKAGK